MSELPSVTLRNVLDLVIFYAFSGRSVVLHFAILLHVAVTSHMTKTTWGKEIGFLDLQVIVHP